MSTRRDFLKKAGMLAGSTALCGTLPSSIKRAMAINPNVGSTFYDAEHVVFLMQENRSFDHCFGTLQGVRGFNDPRAIDLPNKNKVWLQSNRKGETYTPFRLNMKDTNSTWMGSLPHSWENQVDARNQGKYDNWLNAKQPANKEFREMPFTLGYYNREDIPFYYAFADAFTVCDQHFCSSLTGTTSNRMFFWTGKIKDKTGSPAWVRNSDIGYNKEVNWKTFPERLEEHNISWKVYQNELSVQTELKGEDSSLLANYTNNNLEWFSQYNVRFSPGHYNFLMKTEKELKDKINELQNKLKNDAANAELKNKVEELEKKHTHIRKAVEKWSPENFDNLDPIAKNLHNKGLSTNHKKPDYHETELLTYTDEEGKEKTLKAPKGDIFHEFRKDVENGKLPTVSWLVAPEYFSDHPSAPWYGAWYVSETLDILTKNPEVWKKTIFILNYDENDGFFDHIPPYVAPNPKDITTGKTSKNIDSSDEFVTLEEEVEKKGVTEEWARESPVGLGYRVPLIVASPWSRGGWVNSELCDITSTLMFLEKFLNKKFNLNIKEENISSWRRTISGDLTSAFRPYNGEKINFPEKIERNAFMKSIHEAKNKQLPKGYQNLSEKQIKDINKNPRQTSYMPGQEKGIRASNALKYELQVSEELKPGQEAFSLTFEAGSSLFGEESLGTAYNVYAPGKFKQPTKKNEQEFSPVKTWSFATEAGDKVTYDWKLSDFKDQQYHLRVYGPNGFYREYKGLPDNFLNVETKYSLKERDKRANIILELHNFNKANSVECVIKNTVYADETFTETIQPETTQRIVFDTSKAYNWYDLEVKIQNNPSYLRRFAGRVETGQATKTDPYMGGLL